VVFDNLTDIARIDPSLRPADPGTDLVPVPIGGTEGFEDITAADDRCFALVESLPHPDGGFRPMIHELDPDLRPVRARWVDVPVARPNKGLEGLGCVHRNGRLHLLGLYEGNWGLGGASGRRPGGGRIEVLVEGAQTWEPVATIRLPATLPFADYSAIAVRGDRLAVTSQRSSALWVGRLSASDWRVNGPGTVYLFPRDRLGRTMYGTVEGVTWLDDDLFAVVSDRVKRNQPRRLRATHESVHIVALPPPSAATPPDPADPQIP
jgi:hypothetical protein